MAAYRLAIKPGAAKELEAVDGKADRQRLVRRIQALAEDPRPAGCEKLSGQIDLYRIRCGHWRVVYEIDHGVVFVTVVKIGHRKNIYRTL